MRGDQPTPKLAGVGNESTEEGGGGWEFIGLSAAVFVTEGKNVVGLWVAVAPSPLFGSTALVRIHGRRPLQSVCVGVFHRRIGLPALPARLKWVHGGINIADRKESVVKRILQRMLWWY